MATDDFIRIKYKREVEGRKKHTSVSVDPDLFSIFAKVRGGVPAARAVLREWAMSIDAERQSGEGLDFDARIGVSRLVQRRMFADINRFVEAGMVVVQQEETDRHPNAPREHPPVAKRQAPRRRPTPAQVAEAV
jgi:hypothetical protein